MFDQVDGLWDSHQQPHVPPLASYIGALMDPASSRLKCRVTTQLSCGVHVHPVVLE